MIRNNAYYELFASYTVPNPEQVGYWIDLGANSKGKIVKIYNENLRQWVKVLDASSEDAVSPVIGSNGNWWVDNRDTGIPAAGKNPYIGENGNWYIFDSVANKYVDSNVVAKGKTAYDIAVESGYTGTYEEYVEMLSNVAKYLDQMEESIDKANAAADRSNLIASNPPKIVNETWYMFDEETNDYVSTDIKAIGDAFTIAKTYASVEAMQADYSNPEVGIGQFVMIDTGDVDNPEDSQLYLKGDTEWKFISDLSGAQGIQGLSAYQIAVQEGFVGSEEDWIASLKGEKGDTGDKGEKGDTGEKGDSFVYSDFTPEQLESLKGQKGDPGNAATVTVGETVTLEPGSDALVENTGNENEAVLKFSIPKGEKGDKGDKGDTGEGVNIKGELLSESELPEEGQPGDAYVIDGNLYVYVGEGGSVVSNPKWSNVGNIKGPQGETGPQGDPGPQGEPGADGAAATIEIGTVSSSEPGTEPTITNSGDSTNAVFNFTIPKGEKGDQGIQGEKGEPGESYTLPTASADTLGGIKVGAGLEINPGTGVLSATGGGTADAVDWANITSKPDFKTVATTGSYDDLTDKPTIPTLDGYATESWVTEQGYLTEHQDISNLATKSEVATKANSADVYTKSQTYTQDEIDSAIKQASATVFKYKGTVANYSSLPTERVYVGDVYTLQDTNEEYVATADSPSATWEYLGVKVDLSDYSTTEQNNAKYQLKGDYATNEALTQGLEVKADATAIPTNISQLTNDSGYLTDAPSDGKQYIRQDSSWKDVSIVDQEQIDQQWTAFCQVVNKILTTGSDQGYASAITVSPEDINALKAPLEGKTGFQHFTPYMIFEFMGGFPAKYAFSSYLEIDKKIIIFCEVFYSIYEYVFTIEVSEEIMKASVSAYFQVIMASDSEISIDSTIIDDSGTRSGNKITLKTGGDGTKVLSDNGKYVEFATKDLVGTKGSVGLIKNGSSVTSFGGYTACPIIDGVPYYKELDTIEKNKLDVIGVDYSQSTVTGISIKNRITYIELNSSKTLEITSYPGGADEMLIIIKNTGSRDITITMFPTYICMNGNSITIPSGKFGEISVIPVEIEGFDKCLITLHVQE